MNHEEMAERIRRQQATINAQIDIILDLRQRRNELASENSRLRMEIDQLTETLREEHSAHE